MKMKEKLLLVFLSLLWTFQVKAFSEAEAKNLVLDFYQTLRELSSCSIYPNHIPTDKSRNLQKKLLGMILEGQQFLYAPNESDYFDIEDNSKGVLFNRYFNIYSEYAMQYDKAGYHKVLYDFDIESCKSVVPPSNKKDVSSHIYYYIYVRKTISVRFDYTLLDLVCVDGNAGKIVGIGNKCGGYSPDEYVKNDYNSVMAHAAWAYSNGDYDDAYNTYLQANWLDNKMCEPYYRLALMIYFKKGIKGRFKNKKERREKMDYYLWRAKTHYGERNFLQFHQDVDNLIYILYGGGLV